MSDHKLEERSLRVADYAKMIALDCKMSEAEIESICEAARLFVLNKDTVENEPTIEKTDAYKIIKVAYDYDIMSSGDEDKDPMNQQAVREKLVIGEGDKYDSFFANAMVRLIDRDPEYKLREDNNNEEQVVEERLVCGEYKSAHSYGIAVLEQVTRIRFKYEKPEDFTEGFSMPSLILFDSFDGRVHTSKRGMLHFVYMEYGELWFDGHIICTSARNIKINKIESYEADDESEKDIYEVETVRDRDHIRIRMKGGGVKEEIIAALPDKSRYAYISLTGENCIISDIDVSHTGITVKEGEIPRISEEISYINKLESDIPNIQIDGFRAETTEGVCITDGLRLRFHTMSLPAASLIWHCPYIVLYSSKDGKINGDNYTEYAFIKLDGEKQDKNPYVKEEYTFHKDDTFPGWSRWKELNKKGMECIIEFRRRRSTISFTTANLGLHIRYTMTVVTGKDVYVALTGDQCAITDIRVAN